MRNKQFSVGIPETTKRKLRKKAREDGRSLSAYVARLIEADVNGVTDPAEESTSGQVLKNGKPRELATA